jgi:hypothetical protein
VKGRATVGPKGGLQLVQREAYSWSKGRATVGPKGGLQLVQREGYSRSKSVPINNVLMCAVIIIM